MEDEGGGGEVIIVVKCREGHIWGLPYAFALSASHLFMLAGAE